MAAKKRTPVNRYLRYELTNSGTPGTETSHYIDLAKDLSAINRRLYRQGRAYHVKRVSIVSSNTNVIAPGNAAGRITFSTAHDTWVTRNAWRRGFETKQAMDKMALKTMGSSAKPTFHDFKVYLSNDHRTGTVLAPKDNGGNNVQAGEWVYSTFVSPDGTTGADDFEAVIHGDHVGAAGSRTVVGLVKSYSATRATVQDTSPDLPGGASDDPLVNLFDDGTVLDEIVNDLETHNDAPPYNPNNYPGGDLNHPKPCVVQQTTLGTDGKSSVGGFTAMCGLIEIEATSPIASDVYSVLVELAPGNYRGIAAEVI
jgi:hypothetical protein